MNAIRILIVEDSPTARMLLREMVESQPDMTVIAEATNGARAIELACELEPDLVVMDVHMPGMSGIEATGEIMRRSPRPIVIVSSSMDVREHPAAFEAVRMGALKVMDKPRGLHAASMAAVARDFTDVLRALAGVRVVRTTGGTRRAPSSGRLQRVGARRSMRDGVVGIGASTGGPVALQQVLSSLPPDFPCPVLVTQHITPGFAASYAAWLNQLTRLDVRLAVQGARLEPGVVFVASEDSHLGVRRDRTISLSHEPPYRGQRPSVNRMFLSLAEHVGQDTVAIQLTGMGDDGAEGAEAVLVAGGLVVIQDPSTATISSMPESALQRCPGARVLPLGDIADALCDVTNVRRPEPAVASASGSATSLSLPTVPSARSANLRRDAAGDGRARAMVVDDSRTFRLILNDAIARAGFDVSEAASADEARGLMHADGMPDLLVLDWNMPGLSGIDFVRELRANPAARAMHILMVTSVTDTEHIELARRAGVDAYVTKPFSDTDLHDALRRLEASRVAGGG